MTIKGFQVEMRVVVFDEPGARPQGFVGSEDTILCPKT